MSEKPSDPIIHIGGSRTPVKVPAEVINRVEEAVTNAGDNVRVKNIAEVTNLTPTVVSSIIENLNKIKALLAGRKDQ